MTKVTLLKFLVFYWLLSWFVPCNSQETLDAENKSRFGKIKRYVEKADYYARHDSIKQLIDCFGKLATLHIDNSEDQKAFVYCQKTLMIAQKYKLDIPGKCYFDLGRIYSDWGVYDSSVIYYNKGLEIARARKDLPLQADILNNIGYMHRLWQNYDLALEAFKATLEIDIQLKDSALIASDLNNIAYAYRFKKDYKNALIYYRKSLNISIPKNYVFEMGLAHGGLASVYLAQGKYMLADAMVRKAIACYIESEYNNYLPVVYVKLGSIYLKRQIVDSALYYTDKGYQLAQSVNDAETIVDAFDLYSEIYFYMDDFNKANLFKNKYTQLKDSLFNVQKHKQLAAFQSKYEVKKYEQELADLNLEKSKILVKQKILILGGIALLVILVVIIFKLQQRHKQAKILIQFLKDQKEEIESNLLKQKEASTSTTNSWSLPEDAVIEIYEHISAFLRETKYYLDDELTLQSLAQKCEVQAHHVSKSINTLTNSNFSDFINSFRIAEAKVRLLSPEFQNFTIDAIGQCVGFKSRTSFIAAFKKFEGVTPSEYKKSCSVDVS